jgi:hypothetical protein
MIFRIDEDGVVGTCSHAGFATDTNRFVEIDDAVGAFEHCRRRASRDAGRMRALIAARHLVRATHGGKHTNVNVLYVSSRNRKRYQVFRFAGGGARVTADAACVIDHLGPLHRLVLWLFEHQAMVSGRE